MILIAMQLLPRGSLRAALRDPEMRQELQWGRHGRQVALDVAAALDHMHTQFRLLHSDLKARLRAWALAGAAQCSARAYDARSAWRLTIASLSVHASPPRRPPLQCANVLLSEDWRASVSDLGLSQVPPLGCWLGGALLAWPPWARTCRGQSAHT